MTATTPVLTDSQTLDEVVNCLTENLPIHAQGKCEQKNIFEILIRAATQKDSLENTTKVLKNVPTSNDIRYHLEKYSDLASLEEASSSRPQLWGSLRSLFTVRLMLVGFWSLLIS
jgi:putative transposase